MRVETVSRRRIGDMGYPAKLWLVWEAAPGTTPMPSGFYDRERALAWAAASPHRHMKSTPVCIKDAS
jgi:hypothetical protein